MKKRSVLGAVLLVCLAGALLASGCAAPNEHFKQQGYYKNIGDGSVSWIETVNTGSNQAAVGTGCYVVTRDVFGNYTFQPLGFGAAAGAWPQAWQGAIGHTLGGAAGGAFVGLGISSGLGGIANSTAVAEAVRRAILGGMQSY